MTTSTEEDLTSTSSLTDLDHLHENGVTDNDPHDTGTLSDSFSKDYSSLSDSDDVFSDISQSPISLVNPTKIPFTPDNDMRSAEDICSLSLSLSNDLFNISDCESADCSTTTDYCNSDSDSTTENTSALQISSESVRYHRYRSSGTTSGHNQTPNLSSTSSETTLNLSHADMRRCSRSASDVRNSSRLSYVARALALARPTSPPPPYKWESHPTVLTLRSYFSFTQVGSRPHSAPNHRSRQGRSFDPDDMTNEPYTLQATHVLQPFHNPGPPPAVTSQPSTSSAAHPTRTNRSSAISSSGLPTSPLSPFTRRRAEDPTFGLDLVGTHTQPYSYSNPPCSYNNARSSRTRSDGVQYMMVESQVFSSPTLIIDTRLPCDDDDTPPPPPYSAGDWTASAILRAPRYSEVVNPHCIRHSRLFGRGSAFVCMGSVRTLAIGITLCCCGVVFLMVTYVFGAVKNVYLGYLGVLQVIIGLTLICLVAIYNSGRCDFINIIKRARLCPCLAASNPSTRLF